MNNQHTKIINNHWVLSLIVLLGFSVPTITNIVIHGYDPLAFIFLHFLIATVALFSSTSKINSLDAYVVYVIRWAIYPLIFVLYVLFGFIDRKKIRWLKKYWFYVCLNQLWKYMHSPVNNLLK